MVGAGHARSGPVGPPALAPARNGRGALTPLNWVEVAGRALCGLGALLLAFAGFQLWGTALIERRVQDQAAAQLEARWRQEAVTAAVHQLEQAPAASTDGDPTAPPGPAAASAGRAANQANPPTGATARTAIAPTPPVVAGQPLGLIEIPAIGLSKVFLEGVDRDTLRTGPGRYPGTALPGQAGNVAIAGHRTTHGAPFLHLDELRPGDEITLETQEGLLRYQVQGHTNADGTVTGHQIVSPDDVGVLADHGDNRLTLTACHPRYSARQRIVVTATLVGPLPAPADAAAAAATGTAATATATAADGIIDTATSTGAVTGATTTTGTDALDVTAADATTLEGSLGWQGQELEPTLKWATVTALAAHGAWITGRIWRRRLAYGLALPVVAPCLFVCFVHLDRLLPAF